MGNTNTNVKGDEPAVAGQALGAAVGNLFEQISNSGGPEMQQMFSQWAGSAANMLDMNRQREYSIYHGVDEIDGVPVEVRDFHSDMNESFKQRLIALHELYKEYNHSDPNVYVDPLENLTDDYEVHVKLSAELRLRLSKPSHTVYVIIKTETMGVCALDNSAGAFSMLNAVRENTSNPSVFEPYGQLLSVGGQWKTPANIEYYSGEQMVQDTVSGMSGIMQTAATLCAATEQADNDGNEDANQESNEDATENIIEDSTEDVAEIIIEDNEAEAETTEDANNTEESNNPVNINVSVHISSGEVSQNILEDVFNIINGESNDTPPISED